MVDSKKLQVEIEKTIKKSDDLNLNFDNTLKKMYIPTNSENKKKKIMTDLRRDVKKMHKFLENFRNWQKNDICKQKEISKQIREIEDREVSFKSLDLKTANAVVESDGEEITCLSNNNQLVRWIERCIKQILSHQDKIVIQLDGLQHSKRKRGSREKQQKMENYRKLIECHEYHAKYCRLILKGVHNHTIKLSQVEYLIPKLDDYIRNNAYDENSKLFYERLYIFEDDLDADSTSTQSKDSDKELNSDTARSTSVESTVSKLSNLIAPSSSETIENETKDNILTYLSTEEKNTIQVVNIDILPSTVEEVKESVNNPKKQETEISEHKQSKAKVSPKVQNITKLVETLVPHVATEKLTKNFRLNPNYAIHPLWNPNNSNAEQKSLLVTISKSANNYPLKRLVQRNVARLSSAPASTPQYYPQESLAYFNDPKFYDLVQLETLFFIFYFLEGTLSQYYAAKALKKQFWAFHTDQKIWYQRKQEPEEIGEDYEKGSYIYYDYKEMQIFIKPSFVFHYKYLDNLTLK